MEGGVTVARPHGSTNTPVMIGTSDVDDPLPGMEQPYANCKQVTVKLQGPSDAGVPRDSPEGTGGLEGQEMGFVLRSSGYAQGSCEFDVSGSSYMQETSDCESEEIDFIQELIATGLNTQNNVLRQQNQPQKLELPGEYLEYTNKEGGVVPQQATPPAGEDPLWYRQRDSYMLQGPGKGAEPMPNPHGNQNGHAVSHDSLLPLPYETAPKQHSSTNWTNSRSAMASRPLPPSPVETHPYPAKSHLADAPSLDPMANRPLPLSPVDSNEWWVSSSSTDLQRNGRGGTLPSIGLHPRLGQSVSGDSTHNPLYRRMSGDSTLGAQKSSNGGFTMSTLPTSARGGGSMRSRDGQSSVMERRWQSARKLRQYRSESDQALR